MSEVLWAYRLLPIGYMNFIPVLILILSCQVSFARAAKIWDYPTEASLDASISNIDVNLYRLHEQEIKIARSSLSKDLTDEERKMSLQKMMRQKNQDTLRNLPKGVSSHLTRVDVDEVHRAILSQAVVGKAALIKYDPRRKIGFCFGQATYVHLELLRRGVPPQNIGKIFVLGKLFNGSSEWDFHVSTVVKMSTGEWIAIDGLAPSPLSLVDWMEMASQWSADPAEIPPRFYFTDAAKFQPTPGAYDKDRLDLPMYNGYFKDLLESFKASPQPAP